MPHALCSSANLTGCKLGEGAHQSAGRSGVAAFENRAVGDHLVNAADGIDVVYHIDVVHQIAVYFRDVEVASSNLVTPTTQPINLQHFAKGAVFLFASYGPDYVGNYGFGRLIRPLCL